MLPSSPLSPSFHSGCLKALEEKITRPVCGAIKNHLVSIDAKPSLCVSMVYSYSYFICLWNGSKVAPFAKQIFWDLSHLLGYIPSSIPFTFLEWSLCIPWATYCTPSGSQLRFSEVREYSDGLRFPQWSPGTCCVPFHSTCHIIFNYLSIHLLHLTTGCVGPCFSSSSWYPQQTRGTRIGLLNGWRVPAIPNGPWSCYWQHVYTILYFKLDTVLAEIV